VLNAGDPAAIARALSGLVLDFSLNNLPRAQMHPLVARALSCIEENYHQELSLKTLAAEYNVSQTYLGRIFKKDTGSLFTEYLCNYRIERAKDFLLSTSQKSAEIAEKTGFGNPNYFANVFKKKVGVYPTLFRQRNRPV
jgi:two-component system response regulator YesN